MAVKGWGQILRRCDEQLIVVKSSGLALIAGIVFGVAGGCVVALGLYYLSRLYFSPRTLVYLPFGLAFFLFGYRISSPSLLKIDRVTRTYTGYRGWFPFRQQFGGSWQDFDHLSLKGSPGGRDNDVWTIFLNRHDTRGKSFLLYSANGANARGEAQQQAQVLASLLNLPLVDENNQPITGDYHPAPAPLVAKIDSKLLDEYAGHYLFELSVGWGIDIDAGFDVVREGERLFICKNKNKQELLPENETTFFTKGSELRTIFVRDAAGKVAKIREGTAEFKKIK